MASAEVIAAMTKSTNMQRAKAVELLLNRTLNADSAGRHLNVVKESWVRCCEGAPFCISLLPVPDDCVTVVSVRFFKNSSERKEDGGWRVVNVSQLPRAGTQANA